VETSAPDIKAPVDGDELLRGASEDAPHLLERDDLESGKTAVVCGDRSRTYGELRDATRRVAAGLVGLGIEVMDRVAVLSHNRLEFPEIEIGIAGAGAVMVALDWRLRPNELADRLRRSGARAIFLEEHFLPTILELRATGAVRSLRTVISLQDGPADLSYEEMLASLATPRPLVARPAAHPRKLLFAADGGRCRGVVWTEGAVLRNSQYQASYHRLCRNHSTYAVIDQCDVGGRHDLTWAALREGGTVHVARSRGIKSCDVFGYVAEHGITHLAWSPRPQRDVAMLPLPGEYDVSRLDTIVCEWRSLPAGAAAQAQDAFPHIDVVQVYGLPDGGPSITRLRAEHERSKPGSAGLPWPSMEVRVVAGEVQARGPSLSTLTWEDGALKDCDLGDGWVATGDRGRVDDDGFLFPSERLAHDRAAPGGLDWRIG
jgi:acyl-CoA synthetase (AMP-forming)/AMP-acid ligase II